MIEFGSDFHFITQGEGKDSTFYDFFPSAQYYADGRQAIINLYKHQGWKRLWVPEYFCYEVLDSLHAADLNLALYCDYPAANDSEYINQILFRDGDAILRMNYFGTRGFRSNLTINVPVVEDHTHDPIGDWARNSDADWCIASLRKTLPIPEGGILWSPIGHSMPQEPLNSADNEIIGRRRWNAMKLKAAYLSGENLDKSVFREEMLDTEVFFDSASISSIDCITKDYLNSFDLLDWNRRKQLNWMELGSLSADHFKLLLPENDDCNAFSYTILCDSVGYRDYLRKLLIKNSIYPAILWDVPDYASPLIRDFSSRMLSLHCDARYSIEEIQQMKSIVESIL